MEGYSAYVIPSEDILLGSSNGRRLSPVRRFFCLLVTFDLLFTLLLWVLSIILSKGGTPIVDAFKLEVLQYNFQTRLFDVVMGATVRFVILLLFYGMMRCQHWIPVAFTTTATCAFLLIKVFLFRWEIVSNATYPVMLILSSFIISWSEAWFFDFRVIPQEVQAALFHARQTEGGSGDSQRVITWLGRSVSQIAENVHHHRSYPASTAEFFSLPDSPLLSDEEDSETESMEKRAKRLYKNKPEMAPIDSTECQMWIQQGPVIVDELLAKVSQPVWHLEKTTESGDNVFITKTPVKSKHKVFKFSGIIQGSPAKVALELFQNFEGMTDWNPSVQHCEIVQKLNPWTDVSYQVSKEGGGGTVSPRDFVTLRHHKAFENGTHVIATVSVKHPLKPKIHKATRASNGVMGFVLTPVDGHSNRTEYQWLVDMDLQLSSWIPQKVIDKVFLNASLATISGLRSKLATVVDQIDMEIDSTVEA